MGNSSMILLPCDFVSIIGFRILIWLYVFMTEFVCLHHRFWNGGVIILFWIINTCFCPLTLFLFCAPPGRSCSVWLAGWVLRFPSLQLKSSTLVLCSKLWTLYLNLFTYRLALYHPFRVGYDGQRPWLYFICMLPVGVYIYAVIYQVEILVYPYFRGDSPRFSAEVLSPFSLLFREEGTWLYVGPTLD